MPKSVSVSELPPYAQRLINYLDEIGTRIDAFGRESTRCAVIIPGDTTPAIRAALARIVDAAADLYELLRDQEGK